MEFRMLGPLEVLEDGRPLPLGRLKERVVLAVLLLHANEFVSRERLIDEIWGVAPPPTAKKAVNVYVSKLRKTLARNGHDPIATVDGGYRLVVDRDLIDAERARRLVASANERMSSGDSSGASQLLEQAVALWRGPTLAGLALESFGRDEMTELDELRLTALMDRIDCDLAEGRHERVLGELQVLVREHPLRERLRAQQLLALYRADRQADALEAYQQTRRDLIDELGIEPSESLQRLQQAILQHDPALEAPTGIATVNESRPSTRPTAPAEATRERAPRQRFRSRRWRLALAALVVAGGSLAAILVASGSPAAPPRIIPNSLVKLDPRTGKPVLVVRVGALPGPIAITPTAVWTANVGSNTVSRYDLRAHSVDSRAGFPAEPFDIKVDGDGNAWITSSYEDHAPARNAFLSWLEAGAGGTSAGGTVFPSHFTTMPLPLPMAGMEALGAGRLWVIVGWHGPLDGDNRVALVDLSTDQVASVVRLKESATAIAFGYGSAWIGTYARDSELQAIRAGDSKVTRVVLDASAWSAAAGAAWGPVAIAVGYGAVWALDHDQLVKVDPQTFQIVDRVDLSRERPDALTVGAGAVWASVFEKDSLIEIDPHTDRIIRTFTLGGPGVNPCNVAAAPSSLWVAIGDKTCGIVGS